jgi:hypothetical protein
VINKISKSGRVNKSRICANSINLMVPVKRIIEKLENQGICRVEDYDKGKIIPTRKISWMNLPLPEIIRRYNYIIQG